jgi:hypothetical protein
VNRDELRKINSATKYPSILTYHKMDPANGMLQEGLTAEWSGSLVATEKIDGTSARIIVPPMMGDVPAWLIGSREVLLTADGDRVANYDLGIVEVLEEIAHDVARWLRKPGFIVTAYFEVFGQRGSDRWKQYGDGTRPGARLFDIADVRVTTLGMDLPQISAWRDRGNQEFTSWHLLPEQATFMGVSSVPELFTVDASELPTTVVATADWLKLKIPETHAKLTPEGKGNAEGLVLRSADRGVIAKLRHDDYQGTLRRRQGSAKPLKLKVTPEMEGFGV